MDRAQIVAELRRIAQDLKQVPGMQRFASAAGISKHAWMKYWSRYSDLVNEAQLKPNALDEPWPEAELSDFLIKLASDLGRFPTDGDIRVERQRNSEFPSHTAFRRLGRKPDVLSAVRIRAESRGLSDVVEMCDRAASNLAKKVEAKEPETASDSELTPGDVYLYKSASLYEIGCSVHAGARERQLQLQSAEAGEVVHTIRTDDRRGIEAYWHHRFAAKRKHGEWFDLNASDVRAFKSRKKM